MASTTSNELTATTDQWNKRARFNESNNTTTLINASSPTTADRSTLTPHSPPISILRSPTFTPPPPTTPSPPPPSTPPPTSNHQNPYSALQIQLNPFSVT